ncbi:hypothetical protein PHMEG_00034774 [Phytophthora megakarya]|uniref:Uncharacterized protein n=1 Tax=Phytophthora megakarya TaxID=4795 RepID=A0A225URU9_9STRA|nr:hypothetical protein PHMEG_00034774 [Phytophthora megakarya]
MELHTSDASDESTESELTDALIRSLHVQTLVPRIANSLVEYHANIGCYQCYLFLDSHKQEKTVEFDVANLSVRVEFPRVELAYEGEDSEKAIVWWTDIERNIDVSQCQVEDKEDHWYLRLPIRPSDKQPLGGFSSFTQVSPVELRPESYTSVSCRGCNAELLGEGSVIEKVLPLPSANWMDMFDFWGAGIGAFEHIPRDDIHAQQHRVLVGESYVLLHAADFVAATTVTDDADKAAAAPGDNEKDDCEWTHLACAQCLERVGLCNVEQPDTVQEANIFAKYTIDSILSAKLLEMADSDGIFRFTLTSWETMIKQQDTSKFHRVLKVLYGPRQLMPSIPGLLPSHEVSLPPAMCSAITKRLQTSSTLLPSSLRKFNRMNVGYLFA